MTEHHAIIRCYQPTDDALLFDLLEREGEEWSDYWRGAGREKYSKALGNSIAYLLFSGEELCGYVRCRDDDGFGVYIYDLFVDKLHRGKEYGRLLIEQVYRAYPGHDVYIFGDNYPYYEKLGYAIVGSVYLVKLQNG